MDDAQNKVSQELTNRIITAGSTAEIFGLFFVLGSIACYFLFPSIFFSLIIIFAIQIISGILLAVIGWRIRKNPTHDARKQMYVALALGIVVIVIDFFILGGISLASLFIVVNSALGISSAKKLLNQESLMQEVQRRQNIKNWDARQKMFDFLKVLVIAICVVAALVLADLARYEYTVQPPLSSNPIVNDTALKMPGDIKTKSDYVIDEDILSLIVNAGSYETDNHMNYTGYCQTTAAQSLLHEISTLNVGGVAGEKCTDGDYGLSVSSSLNNGGYECMDSTGYYSKQEKALNTGPLCQPLVSNTQPTWYVIIPKGNPLTNAQVGVEYGGFVPIDNVGPVQVVAGSIPPGLTLECLSGTTQCTSNQNGKEFLMGAPIKVGTYTFTLAYSNGSYKLTTTFTIIVTK